MENLKIKVNSESESKEVQELFFELGYVWHDTKCKTQMRYVKPVYYSSFDDMELACDVSDVNYKHKEITLPELRDLVVLKRNSIDDATHEDKNDPEFKYRLIDSHWYVITEGNPVWRKDSIDLNEAPLFIKPIEKQMKEYLRKNSNDTYSYIGTVRPEHVSDFMIEIPEGAQVYAVNNGYHYFFSSAGIGFEWSVLWQRHTLPEELPFVDDEPKIETATGYQLDAVGSNTYGSRSRYDGESDISYRQYLMNFIVGNRTESLNDQYAEIEKVRQSHRTASEIADSALKHIRERAETYDQPTGERSATKTAKAFNAITGKDITESEVWLLLQLLKDVRQWSREDYHQDSAEDCIAYASLKAESLEGGE